MKKVEVLVECMQWISQFFGILCMMYLMEVKVMGILFVFRVVLGLQCMIRKMLVMIWMIRISRVRELKKYQKLKFFGVQYFERCFLNMVVVGKWVLIYFSKLFFRDLLDLYFLKLLVVIFYVFFLFLLIRIWVLVRYMCGGILRLVGVGFVLYIWLVKLKVELWYGYRKLLSYLLGIFFLVLVLNLEEGEQLRWVQILMISMIFGLIEWVLFWVQGGCCFFFDFGLVILLVSLGRVFSIFLVWLMIQIGLLCYLIVNI